MWWVSIASTHTTNPMASNFLFWSRAEPNAVFPNQPESEKLWSRGTCISKQQGEQLRSSGRSDSEWPSRTLRAGNRGGEKCWILAWILAHQMI